MKLGYIVIYLILVIIDEVVINCFYKKCEFIVVVK